MPSASLSGRLAIGTGALAMAFVATAGPTVPAQATVHHRRLPGLHRQHPAVVPARHLTALAVLRPATPAQHAQHAQHASAAPPKISSVVPAAGAPGWHVTLAGRGFRHVTSVTFGKVSATATVRSSHRITATVPGGARTGRITVRTRAGKARSATFTVTPEQTLEPGEMLPSAQALRSKDGHYTLAMRGNGNLVYYVTGTGHTLWASGTAGDPGAYLTMLGNGNLIVYSASGARTLWSSRTSGQGPARLVAQTNGNLIVYQGSTPTWAAGSYDAVLEPGERLRPGWFLSSGNGYKLTMQKNGNLVEEGPSGPRWSTRTPGHTGATLTMRASGNLVVRRRATLWASKTWAHRGAALVDQRNGVLVIRYKGRTVWASKKGSGRPVTRLTLGKWAGQAGPAAADRNYGYPYPHPPACTDGGACDADKWAFYRGQCTSWVAYRLNQLNAIAFANSYGGKGRWGNAVNWRRQAQALRIAVNATPAVGAIAWYASTRRARGGHVAYVEKVNSPTSIVISELNYDSDNGFWVHTITKATGDWPSDFLHLADR